MLDATIRTEARVATQVANLRGRTRAPARDVAAVLDTTIRVEVQVTTQVEVQVATQVVSLVTLRGRTCVPTRDVTAPAIAGPASLTATILGVSRAPTRDDTAPAMAVFTKVDHHVPIVAVHGMNRYPRAQAPLLRRRHRQRQAPVPTTAC